MRPIDADALSGKMNIYKDDEGEEYVELSAVRSIIQHAPTLDVVPVNPVRRKILNTAIKHYGTGAQRFKAIEELGELIQALARCDDRDNISEEMADVRIMLDQLEIMLGNSAAVRGWELKKLKRLDERVHAADTVG